jgi:rod shape-determining protein MreC
VPPYAGPPAARPGDVAGVLRLLVYLVLAVVLMVLDHRGGWLRAARAQAEVAVQPLWWIAGLPSRAGTALREDAVTRSQLMHDNEVLRNALLVSGARTARLQAAAAENARLRGLLASAERGRLDVQLAAILDIDLDPTRQRLVLDAGSRDGVRPGQAVIDAGGLMGQVVATTPGSANVLLITDPDHVVPAVVARSGVRLMVYGGGRTDMLHATDIPLSADIRAGDVLLTSGMGGRFPPGFAIGTIGTLVPDDSRAFLEGDVKPAAQLDRGRDVLLLRGYKPVAAKQDTPPPCLQGEGGRACEAQRAEPSAGSDSMQRKQPLPNPPLPSQGREQSPEPAR